MDFDHWTTAATTDDSLVAEILLRLKHSTKTKAAAVIPFRWGRRKARSRPDVTRFAMRKVFKERATRSPTTPLSWSGGCGTSVSGDVDGFETSSMMCRRSTTGSRSKNTATNELVNGQKGTRKKSYSELKKEEFLLLNERLNLNRDLANMHASLTHHRVTNQNLKRFKNMNVHSRKVITSVTQHPVVCVPIQAFTTQGNIFKAQDLNNGIPLASFSSNNSPEANDKKSFTLPDLNMLPSIE